MKNFSQSFIAFFILLFCCSSSSEKKPGKNKIAIPDNEIPNAKPLVQNNQLFGDWKLSVETYDDNENKKLDPEEKKKAFSNHFFFRFNADGTGLVNFNNTSQGAFKSHYKLSTRKNLQFLSVFIDEDKTENPDGLNGGYYIISVDKNELVLLGGLDEKAFWILKKS